MKNRLLGREPVITVSLVVAILISLLPLFGWPTETVGVVAGALVVLGGAIEAALISVDRLLPLLVGVGKAVLAVAGAFSLHLPDNQVSALMALLTVLAGLQVRKQVVPEQSVNWQRLRDAAPGPLLSGEFVRGWGGPGTWTTELRADIDSTSSEQPLPEAEPHSGERESGGYGQPDR